jgi:class 3 adenylate cyclase
MMLASYSELIEKKTRSLAREQRRVERLLFNVLPEKCVNELRSYGRTKPERFHEVSVLFLDFVGFTELSQRMSTERLFNELNELFTAFDAIITEHCCERIKTIGDAYLAVCGMPDRIQGHAELISSAAFKMRAFVEERNLTHQTTWRCRIGLHTGEVTGGVVGRLKYIYDVFGDGVNTASRMESNSEPMKINLSVALRERLGPAYKVSSRGMVDVKGKGMMEMFFLDDIEGEPCADRLRPHIPRQETIDEDVSVF